MNWKDELNKLLPKGRLSIETDRGRIVSFIESLLKEARIEENKYWMDKTKNYTMYGNRISELEGKGAIK